MLKKLIWLFIAGLLINSLSGCNPYSKEEFKKVIQSGFDRYRIKNKLKGNFCFDIDSIKFPYTEKVLAKDATEGKKIDELILARTLSLFSEVGLLNRKPVDSQPELYHYELTELGKEYNHNSRSYYSNAFCYGVIKVDKVTNIKVENNRKMPYPHKHEVYVDYDYHVEDVPEWVVLNQEKLSKRYDTSIELEGQKYEEMKRYQGEKDGYLHLFSGGYYMSMTPRLLEDEK